MSPQLPIERTLPGKQQILDRILDEPLAGASSNDRRQRPWLVSVLAVASVAAIFLPQALGSNDLTSAPAAEATPPEISLDLGPLSKAEIAEALKVCSMPDGWVDKVLHARRFRTDWGTGEEWTIAVQGYSGADKGVPAGDGRLLACHGLPTKKGSAALPGEGFALEPFHAGDGPAPSAEELAKLPPGSSLTKERYDDRFRPQLGVPIEPRIDRKFVATKWVKVPSVVTKVRQRLVVNGKPQTWFSSNPSGGLSFVQAWMDAPMNRADKVVLEVQFLDRSNQLVQIPGSNGPTSVLERSWYSISPFLPWRDYTDDPEPWRADRPIEPTEGG